MFGYMKYLILPAICAILTACASLPDAAARVEVQRHDGSRQCYGGGISPEAMQAQLHGIRVYAARKDVLHGMAFAAVCGGGTPNINVYTIAADDLALAEQRGFQLLKQQPWD